MTDSRSSRCSFSFLLLCGRKPSSDVIRLQTKRVSSRPQRVPNWTRNLVRRIESNGFRVTTASYSIVVPCAQPTNILTPPLQTTKDSTITHYTLNPLGGLTERQAWSESQRLTKNARQEQRLSKDCNVCVYSSYSCCSPSSARPCN